MPVDTIAKWSPTTMQIYINAPKTKRMLVDVARSSQSVTATLAIDNCRIEQEPSFKL